MPRKKLKRMNEVTYLPNVFVGETLDPEWFLDRFGNGTKLTLELGCGRGDYSTALAQRFPERQFIGIDKKGARLWQAANLALAPGLTNLCFLRTQLAQIKDFLPKEAVEEIWIPFPDPYPKNLRSSRRLTSAENLNFYKGLLKPNGRLHLKTDDDWLYRNALQAIRMAGGYIEAHSFDVHRDYPNDEILGIMTTYERRHLARGKIIKYVRFGF